VNQLGLFGSGNDLDTNADLPVDLGDEIAAVFCFARGARGTGDNLVDFVGFGQPSELREGLERGSHGRRRQVAAVEAAGAEPNHVFFAIDDFEREVGSNFHHNHVDGVRAYVNGGNSHAGVYAARPWPCADTCPLYTHERTVAHEAGGAGWPPSYHEPC